MNVVYSVWVLRKSRMPMSRPFRLAPWDSISKKLCMVVNAERQIIFWSLLIFFSWITHMIFVNLKYNLVLEKSLGRKSGLSENVWNTRPWKKVKNYTANSRLSEVVSFLTEKSETKAIFILIFILFSTFFVLSWPPCYCWWRMLRKAI